MNKRKIEEKRREIINLIRPSNRSGSHAGCFRAYASESEEHIRKKFEVWLTLSKLGFEVYTESILNDNKRPDILAVKNGRMFIYEIIESETEEECKQKILSYPNAFACHIIKDLNDIKQIAKEI